MYQISLKLAVPNNLLSKLEHQSNNLSNKLENDFEKVFLKKKLNFVSVKKLLVSNSFHRVLKRGFFIIDENEKPIKEVLMLIHNRKLRLNFTIKPGKLSLKIKFSFSPSSMRPKPLFGSLNNPLFNSF